MIQPCMIMSYIDPGTGSMLFAVLFGVFGAAFFALKKLFARLPLYFTGGRKESLDINETIEYAIFTDSKRYWNVFEPICDEFEKRKIRLVYMTASEDDPALSKQYEYIDRRFIGEGNKAFVTLNTLKARILLSSTPGLDVYQWKRSKNVEYYIHIPHAVSDITLYRMFGIDYFDSILISGQFQEEQIRMLEELRKLPPKEIVLVGQPYMDTLRERVTASYNQNTNSNTTVLVAPSWGKSSILNRYGTEFIKALLATGYNIIIRPHPQSFTSEKELINELMSKFPENDQLEWNKDNDNFDVLNRSDIMISDFSGVLFDFALGFDKPIIYADTSFDKDPYDACWLDEELWTFTTLSKIGIKLNEEHFDSLKTIIEDSILSQKIKENRDKARSECWVNIGKSATIIADYLIRKHEELINNNDKSNSDK